MANTPFWVSWMCLVIRVHLVTVQGAKTGALRGNTTGLQWVSQPWDFNCMENTDAVFNWTFNNVDTVKIVWTYKGTIQNPASVYILGYDQFDKRTTYKPEGDWQSRIDYINYTGSAAMMLTNVTPADDGIYEVRIISTIPNSHPQYIVAEIRLAVYAESRFEYHVDTGAASYELSLAANGTNVVLPDEDMATPTPYAIRVEVSPKAPKPSSIQIRKEVGDLIDTLPCKDTLTCEIEFSMGTQINTDTDIYIGIIFDVQNLNMICITKSIVSRRVVITTQGTPSTLEMSDAPSTSSGYAVGSERSRGHTIGIALFVAALVLVVVTTITLIVFRRRHRSQKQRHPAEDEEVQEENGEEVEKTIRYNATTESLLETHQLLSPEGSCLDDEQRGGPSNTANVTSYTFPTRAILNNHVSSASHGHVTSTFLDRIAQELDTHDAVIIVKDNNEVDADGINTISVTSDPNELSGVR